MNLQEYLDQKDPQRLRDGSVILTKNDVHIWRNSYDVCGVHVPELSKRFGVDSYYIRRETAPILRVANTGSLSVFKLDFDPFKYTAPRHLE